MKIRHILASAVATFSATSIGFAADMNAKTDLQKDIALDYKTNLKALFLDFHQNPELSFIETRTADKLAGELRALGFEVTEKVGRTGVVAVLKNGAGPTVMLRADMDGLPVKEDSGLSYASKVMQTDLDGKEKPVMHACGHDVHVTSLIGAARQLMARKSEWSGTLVLIGQPAEELISGAREMLQDGLYTRFPKPDYAVAFHVWSGAPTGKIEIPYGISYSSSDSVDIVVHGVGAHGASPHQGIDPVLVASQIVVSLQSIVSRSIAPLEPGVITVGSIHGGIKHNIIGDRVDMQVTVRSDSPETRTLLLDGIDRVVKGVAISMNVPKDLMPEVIRSKTQTTAPTKNDFETTKRLRAALTDQIGEDVINDTPRQGMGAEDFAYFIEPDLGVKGVYFNVGGTPEKDVAKAASHHSPFFKVKPEPSIRLGTEAMVISAMTLMPKP